MNENAVLFFKQLFLNLKNIMSASLIKKNV